MRSVKVLLFGAVFASAFVLLWPAQVVLAQASAKPPATVETPELEYKLYVFLPSYHFVSTSGFAGRVGEYDSLQQSVGGEVSLTWLDYTQHLSLKNRSTFVSRDDFDVSTRFKWGKNFTLGIENRSFIRHLDDVPYGTNLDPPSDPSNPLDGTAHTSFIPDSALFGVKRTRNTVNGRIKLPKTPLTLFVSGGWQARRGYSQLQFFDMGAQTNPPILPPDPNSCALACHSTSKFRQLNYTTRNVAGGVEMKINHAVVTFQHEYRSFNDRLQNPVDYFGTAASIEGENLPPLAPPPSTAFVPDTLQGNYVHNVLPRHETQADMLRAHVPLNQSLTFDGNINFGRTRNLYTRNPQNSFNADAALVWNPQPVKKLHAFLDYHQQNTLNEFVPSFYSLFGNPSLHRSWAGLRAEYTLTSLVEVEAFYRRTNIGRSSASLWPQFYSVNSVGLMGTAADAFVPRLVAATFSNSAGFTVKFHRGETWNLRSGYEWIGTHAPGYLTDPQTSHRVFAGGTFSPTQWISVSEDFSLLRQSDFLTATGQAFPRSNRLYLSTSFVTLKPVADWSLGLGYAYSQNSLRTDLIYGTDPFYPESLVPFKAISQSYSVSTNYRINKKLAWNLDFAHVNSTSSLRPDLAVAPLCTSSPLPEPPSCAVSTSFAAAFSRVAVPQILANSSLNYRWRNGVDSGVRFQYGSYHDQVHPELNGHLNTYSLFVGKTW